MGHVKKLRSMPKFIALIVFVAILSAKAAYAGPTALEALMADYEGRCQAMQSELLPDIDAELDAPPPKGILEIDNDAIYEIEIDNAGKTATVVYTSFRCTNFGYPWCGAGGNCTSYLIVDDKLFEWIGGGRPETVKGADTVLIARVVDGYSCKDGNGADGFGAAPCYEVIVWDDERGTFWSSDGDLQFRSELSAP
jgi:hypothetical protein